MSPRYLSDEYLPNEDPADIISCQSNDHELKFGFDARVRDDAGRFASPDWDEERVYARTAIGDLKRHLAWLSDYYAGQADEGRRAVIRETISAKELELKDLEARLQSFSD